MFYGIAQWIPEHLVYPVVHPHTPMNLMDLKCAFPAQPVMQVMVLHLFSRRVQDTQMYTII